MLGLVLAQAALAPRPGPLSPGRRLPLAPCHAPCRCARVRCDFSPAYDTTIRHAAQSQKNIAARLARATSARPSASLALGRAAPATDDATGCRTLRPAPNPRRRAVAGRRGSGSGAASCDVAAEACCARRRRYAAADWGQNLRSLPGSLILRRFASR